MAPLNKRTALSTETKTLHIIIKRYGCISEKLVSVWQQWILHSVHNVKKQTVGCFVVNCSSNKKMCMSKTKNDIKNMGKRHENNDKLTYK